MSDTSDKTATMTAELVQSVGQLLDSAESRAQARELCFRALTADSKNLVARLLLGRLFYLDGMRELCLRELRELQAQHDTAVLRRLLGALGETTAAAQPTEPAGAKEGVVGELDFDAEFLDALDEVESDPDVEKSN